MMNKLRYLLMLVLCAGLVGGATLNGAAQASGDRVLAAGKKPLRQTDVDRMIEFYEWAFETEFTSEQRAQFQANTVTEFRKDPAGNRAAIDDITTTLPRILAAETDVQAETRKNFLKAFMPEAEKNTDENSQLLVGIYENTRDGGNQSNVADNTGEQTVEESNTAVGNFSALAGEWVWGRSGSTTRTTSGVYLGGNASRHVYKFSANGAAEYTGIMNVMTGGCNMQIFKTMKGRATLSGDTLTVKWSPASFSRDDSCSPSKNYKKTLPAETEIFAAKLKNDGGQTQLCLTSSDETCFSRQ